MHDCTIESSTAFAALVQLYRHNRFKTLRYTMGVFKDILDLFAGPRKPVRNEPKKDGPNVEFDDGPGFVTVHNPYFYAPAERSVNGKYLAACADRDVSSHQLAGGHREKGKGAVVLLDGEQILWAKSLERPNNGKVSNKGHVAVEDWLFGNKMNGRFYVFSPEGEEVIQQSFSANLRDCGIADDGSVAYCTTCNSNARDSSRFVVYDLQTKKQMFRMADILYRAPRSITRTDDGVTVETEKGIVYEFNRKGKVLNQSEVDTAVRTAKVASGNTWMLLEIVQERLENNAAIGSDEADELIGYLETAETGTDNKKQIAIVHRRKGEVSLRADRRRDALRYFHRALALDEKVGVKRKATKLARELEAQK